MNIRLKLADSVGLITNYNTLGNIYLRQKKYEAAHTAYQKSLKLGKSLNRTQAINSALSNIGEVYEKQGNLEKALPIYLEVLELDLKTGSQRNIAIDFLLIGKTYSKMGRKEEALQYLNKAETLGLQLPNKINRVYVKRGLAEAYLFLGDYPKALTLAEEALAKATDLGSDINIEEATYILNKIYKARGDFKTAHFYLEKHKAFQDSLKNFQQMKYFAEMHSKYESDKKDVENQQLRTISLYQKETLAQKSKLQNAFLGLLFLASALAYVFFRGKKREKAINAQLSQFNNLILQKSEAIQKQTIELEKLNHQKDILFSVIAHDLRGPLISLQSLLQILSMGTLPQEKLDRFVKDLNTQQRNTLNLLDNLLVWSKVQMKGLQLQTEPVNLSALVDVNLQLLLPQALKKGVCINSLVPPELWALVDPESVKLVIRNLMANALKFSNGGGMVLLSAQALENDKVLLTVKDSGIGISNVNQLKLFGPNSFKERGTANEKGNGLGLMLCKEFVEKNGGEIWIESQEGVGTICYVTLPRYRLDKLPLWEAAPKPKRKSVTNA